MKSNDYYYIYHYTFFILFFIIKSISSQINDNYQVYTLDNESNNYLLDIKDYNNLKLIITTSKKIYKGIPPIYKTTTNAELNNCSSTATINNNYILVSCLNDSLLGKINIETGEYEKLVLYSNISNLLLNPPNISYCSICSLSIFENIVFIGYTKIFEDYKTNIVIKVNITNKNDTEYGPILDLSQEIKYFIFPNNYTNINSIRQIGCEAIYIKNKENEYRLICVYETKDINEEFFIYGFSIKNNFEEIDTNDQERQIYKFTYESGFKLYKIDKFQIKIIMRRNSYHLYLEEKNKIIHINYKNNINYSANKDLFDYNNYFLFSAKEITSSSSFMGINYFYYFSINREDSTNYYKIYDYNIKDTLRLLVNYDEISDCTIFVYQNLYYIKYLSLNNTKRIFDIGSYSDILRLKTNETKEYNLTDLFDSSNFGNLQVESIIKNESNQYTKLIFGESFYNFIINESLLTLESSMNNWYEYNFALIENDINFTRIFFLSNIKLYIRTCTYQCGSCQYDYYKCDSCRDQNFAILKDSDDNNCYPKTIIIKNYLYNPNTNIFEKCYNSCQFCSKSGNQSSSFEHNCESCIEEYLPSYQFLGNCYRTNKNEIYLDKTLNNITDINFTLNECQNFKINTTGECIDDCPNETVYYSFIDNNINLTEMTYNYLNIDTFIKNITLPPKYLFNNKCYEECPLNSKPDNLNNICICEYAFHIENNITICYNVDYCIDNKYKYYLNDTKQCISDKQCPSGYYQFNFQCYKDNCPSDTKEEPINSFNCKSKYNYCYINEEFQNICDNNKNNEYIYKFNDTIQYLKNCEQSLIYTTLEKKTYLYNNTCYLSCPENTFKNNITNVCECEYFKYYEDNEFYICYSNEEKCKEKIPVIDLKLCLNSIEECKNKEYKIFNNECYSQECPNNTKLDIYNNYECICSYFYYNSTNNNTLNCFENSITCDNKNYLYYNPNLKECYISLDDCFSKGNSYFFNHFCYKNECENETIPLLSTNETIQNNFIDELILKENINKICICNINTLYWIKTELNEIQCLEECGEDYEPEPLTHKCIKKCNPIKDYIFNDDCYIDDCPIGTILNMTEKEKTGRKVCICEDLYYINKTNNFMICCNDVNKELCLNIQTTEFSSIGESLIASTYITESSINYNFISSLTTEILNIESSNIKFENDTLIAIISEIDTNYPNTMNDIIEIKYPKEYYDNPDNCLSIYNNECYEKCPNETCLTQFDNNLVYCIPIESDMAVFNDICFHHFYESVKNISENLIIPTHPKIKVNIYSTQSVKNKNLEYFSNSSIIYLNECEQLLLDYYNLTNDTILYIIGIDSPNRDKSYVINVYNYGVFLENGFKLDHLKICNKTKITISSPIINKKSIKYEEAFYFSKFGYDIYDKNNSFYTDQCSPASINGNDITLDDRINDFYISNYSLCNESCEYNSIDFTTERFTCQCSLLYNFSENNNINENKDIKEENEDNISYLDFFLSSFNYKIVICNKLLFKVENYYYNIGFYIGGGILILCLIEMLIFIKYGIMTIKTAILNGIPNIYKLKNQLKNKIKNQNELKLNKLKKMKERAKRNTQKESIKNINYFNFIYINQ